MCLGVWTTGIVVGMDYENLKRFVYNLERAIRSEMATSVSRINPVRMSISKLTSDTIDPTCAIVYLKSSRPLGPVSCDHPKVPSHLSSFKEAFWACHFLTAYITIKTM